MNWRLIRGAWLLALLVLGFLEAGAHPAIGSRSSGAAAPQRDVRVDLGPMIGAVTSASATVWTRLSAAASVRVAYRRVGDSFESSSATVAANASADFTAQLLLPGLAEATDYQYQVVIRQSNGHESRSGTSYFRTLAANPSQLTFSVVADFMVGDVGSRALRAAASPRPDFLAIIGDMDHSDPAIDSSTGKFYKPSQASKVLSLMRRMRREMRMPFTPIGHDLLAAIVNSRDPRSAQIPLYNAWDDHDFCANNADATCPFATQSLQAWREYFVPAPDNGLASGCEHPGVWQRVAVGTLATVFVLDSRSQRDEAGATTMLGACQKQWLLDGLRTAGTVWKIILSPVTFNPGTKTWDGWGHFPAERDEILAFVRDNDVRNVVVLSGDIHSGGAIDDGTASGLPELSVPHVNMPGGWVDTFCKVDHVGGRHTLLSEPGSWTLGGLADPNIGSLPHHCLGQEYDPSFPVVGNRGTRLPVSRSLNAIPAKYLSTLPVRDQKTIDYLSQSFPSPLAGTNSIFGANISRGGLLVPYPQFGSVTVTEPTGYSWYHSAQVRVEKRFSKGYTVNLAYTLAKTMAANSFLNASDTVPYESISDQDRLHRLTIGGIWEFPLGRGKHFGAHMPAVLNFIAGGWQLNGMMQRQSGPPLAWGDVWTLFTGDSKKVLLSKNERSVDRWFNVDAGFNRNSAQQLGSNLRVSPLRFSNLRADGQARWDFSLFKNFKMTEKWTTQFRAECINAWNHPNLVAPNMTPSSSTFGQITDQDATRSWVLSLKVSF